jgi:hypothetical protein
MIRLGKDGVDYAAIVTTDRIDWLKIAISLCIFNISYSLIFLTLLYQFSIVHVSQIGIPLLISTLFITIRQIMYYGNKYWC